MRVCNHWGEPNTGGNRFNPGTIVAFPQCLSNEHGNPPHLFNPGTIVAFPKVYTQQTRKASH